MPPTNGLDLGCLTKKSLEARLRGLLALGPRFTGTAAEGQARRYVLAALSNIGLPAQELAYDYVGWALSETPRFKATAPDRKTFDAMAFIHSSGTPARGLRGRLQYLGHHWVIGCFDWMKFAVLDDNDELIGYVSARPDGPPIPQPLDHQSAIVPHFIVGSDAYELLGNWADAGMTIKIEGTLNSRQGDRASSANIIASYRPEGGPPFRIVVSAHLDSMWGAPGSNDNGGGAVGVLALAHAVTQSPLPVAIDFVWFTGEESNLLGSRAYVSSLGDADLAQIRLLMNLDGIAEAGEQLHIWSGNENLEYQVLQCLRDYPARHDRKTRHVYTFPPRPGMDHVPFYERGLTDMVSFTGFEMVNYHTTQDVYYEPQGSNLEYAVGLAWHLLRNVSTDKSGPVFRGRSQLRTFAEIESNLQSVGARSRPLANHRR